MMRMGGSCIWYSSPSTEAARSKFPSPMASVMRNTTASSWGVATASMSSRVIRPPLAYAPIFSISPIRFVIRSPHRKIKSQASRVSISLPSARKRRRTQSTRSPWSCRAKLTTVPFCLMAAASLVLASPL